MTTFFAKRKAFQAPLSSCGRRLFPQGSAMNKTPRAESGNQAGSAVGGGRVAPGTTCGARTEENPGLIRFLVRGGFLLRETWGLEETMSEGYQVCQACGAIFTVQGVVISGPCPCGSWTWAYPKTIAEARRIRREARGEDG